MPKSKQLVLDKHDNGTSYDHIFKVIHDPLVLVKIAKKLVDFLVVFQTDKPMTLLSSETLEVLISFLMEKFILESVLDKARMFVSLMKIDVHDESKEKPTAFVGLGFAVNHEMHLLKSIKKITDKKAR